MGADRVRPGPGRVHIHGAVANIVRVGVVEAADVRVTPRTEALEEEIAAAAGALRDRYQGLEPSAIPELRPARELYHSVGVDPTRLRPSSEALLRRVLRGEGLPAINSLVDTSNLCSLEFLLPIGLHDLSVVRGTMVIRRGRAGEGYDGIGKGWYSVDGRLTVADDLGACGSPTSDSQRTMITPVTTQCVMVIYAPASFSTDLLGSYVARAEARLHRSNAGAVIATTLLP